MIRKKFLFLPLGSTRTFVYLMVSAMSVHSVCAQAFSYDGEGGANILEGGGDFSGASGQTLNVGVSSNSAQDYVAVVQGLNTQMMSDAPFPQVNVYGHSSLRFVGKTIGEDETHQCIFNFEDQSRLLLDADSRGHAFGGDVVINYNSSAHSINSNIGMMFCRVKGGVFTTMNINAGLIEVGGFNFNRQKAVINLAGGDLILKRLVIKRNDEGVYNAKINFDSSTESKFEITQNGLALLQDGLDGGLFQIDGVVQTDPSAFEVTQSRSAAGVTIRVKGAARVGIPELSITPLILGLVSLAFCAIKRRR